eukprot:scaffold2393_cov267-Pinguiococcus_pyrenoidosus.AAC.11
MILSAAMMLKYDLSQPDLAQMIETAVEQVPINGRAVLSRHRLRQPSHRFLTTASGLRTLQAWIRCGRDSCSFLVRLCSARGRGLTDAAPFRRTWWAARRWARPWWTSLGRCRRPSLRWHSSCLRGPRRQQVVCEEAERVLGGRNVSSKLS